MAQFEGATLVNGKTPVATSTETKKESCKEVGKALDHGSVGEMVEKHEELILKYYADVQAQAQQSFREAKRAVQVGFAVLILTCTYTLAFHLARSLRPDIFKFDPQSMSPMSIGLISGAMIEFIAGVQFWLYSKASKQFGAFHICLERSHRYLVAYKFAQETGDRREQVLENLACIMARAPMIFSASSAENATDRVPDLGELGAPRSQ